MNTLTLLAVFAHPDDEAFGTGGTLTRYAAEGHDFARHHRDEITTVVDVGDYLGAKLRGIQCHATQVGRHSRFADTPDEVTREAWFRYETYILARSTVGWPEGVETDLLAGLR